MNPSNIKLKAFGGLFQLILVLGFVLFVCAGTIRFWQAWTYLFVFAASSILITLYLFRKDLALLQRRLTAGPSGEKTNTQKIIQFFASISFLLIMAFPGLDRRFGWSQVPVWLIVTGDLFVALGFYIVYRVFKENTYTSATIEVAENQTVTSTGPYALVRHPMYSGALLMLFFTPLALGSFWTLPFFIPLLAVIIIRLRDEEKYLSTHLPGYADYCLKVRYRLVPGLW